MENLTQAVYLLKQGGLVAFPTETVYGLGADASNEVAVKKIFTVKQRPTAHPLIVHIPDITHLQQWAREIPPVAWALAQAFWPGPLTLILKKQPAVLPAVTGGQDTVGLRIPRHPVAQALLQQFQGGIAAPSANRFTHVSPTTAEAVYEELGDEVDLILEGGRCEIGLESTIVDLSRGQAVILRPGAVTPEAMSSVIGAPVLKKQPASAPTPLAPGMHALHYAPTTPTQVLDSLQLPAVLEKLTLTKSSAIILLHRSQPFFMHPSLQYVHMPKQATEYAHELYYALREADKQGVEYIFIEQVPNEAAWEAIQDRLAKASGKMNTRGFLKGMNTTIKRDEDRT